MTLKRQVLSIIASLFAIMVVSSSTAQDGITIGAIISVTGSFASHGEPQKKSLLLIQDLINNRGGIFGRKLKIIIYDDESDVNTCLLAAEKILSRENVVAVIGPTTSGNTLAVSRMFEEARIPLLSLAASEKIVSSGRKWIFKAPPSHRHAVTRLLNHMKSKSIRRIAIISAADGTGRAGRSALKDIIPQLGLKIVADEVFHPADSTVTILLEKIMDLGAQAIVCWATASQTAMVARNRAELDIKLPFYGGPQAASRRFIRLSGSASKGVLLPVDRITVFEQIPDDHPQKELIIGYKREYESRYNTAATPAGGYARDAVMLIVKAIEKGSSLTPADIRDSLEQIRNIVGVGGLYDYAPDDHGGIDLNGFEMVRVSRGKFRIVK